MDRRTASLSGNAKKNGAGSGAPVGGDTSHILMPPPPVVPQASSTAAAQQKEVHIPQDVVLKSSHYSLNKAVVSVMATQQYNSIRFCSADQLFLTLA